MSYAPRKALLPGHRNVARDVMHMCSTGSSSRKRYNLALAYTLHPCLVAPYLSGPQEVLLALELDDFSCTRLGLPSFLLISAHEPPKRVLPATF